MKNTNYFLPLRRVLREFGIAEEAYSLRSYAEGAVCLEQQGDLWVVYEGNAGSRCREKRHAYMENACIDLISRVCRDKRKEAEVRRRFENEIVPDCAVGKRL